MDQGEYQAAERLLHHKLAEVEAQNNKRAVAECYSNLGNCAEAQQRYGEAVRYWSRSLLLLKRLGLSDITEADRLRRLIRLHHENAPQVVVWVSYAHKNNERVERVLRKLRRARIKIVYDKEFLAGHSVHRQIVKAIQHCPKHVVFWSRASRESPWVMYESDALLEAWKKQRRRDIKMAPWTT